MKCFFTCSSKKWYRSLIACLLLSFFAHAANAQACYGINNGYGTYFGAVTPGCTNGTLAMASTSYAQWQPTAGVQYNLSISGGSWAAYDMTVYYYNGSAWIPYANSTSGSLSINTTSTYLANNSWFLVAVYNGTGCLPAWIGNSTVLNYSIATPSTPAITQSPTSGSHVCVGNGVTYTASGITTGSFNQFLWGWDAVGGNALGIGNGAAWTSNNPGHTLYVEAQSINGSCTATSSAATVTVDALSNAGSFGYNLYTCNGGYTYTTGGALTFQTITGYTGTILGWGQGSSATCSADVTNFPTGANNATSPWSCCYPGGGSTNTLMVEVQSGVCPVAQSCYTFTQNVLTAPTSASISPAGPVCTPSSGNITLSYVGGGSNYLPATLKWYSGSCGGTLVGSGQNLVIAAPASTTTYYCAWVDPCGVLSSCASATYTVTALPVVSAASYSLCKNATTTLTPASGGTWVSNTPAVATVSGNTVTAVGAGTATFTFTSSTAPNCANTTPAITVTALPTVSITGPTSFCGNATTTLSPTTGGTWVSNTPAAATVSGYTVTGTSAGGSSTFTFTSSTAPNCANTTSAVTVTGIPTVYGVTGGGTYCLGASSVVGLSGSQTGVTYQLVLNGSTNVGSPVTGTGSAISFGGQTQVGTYTVVATTVTNSCTQAMSGNAVVNMLTPIVTNTPATGVGTNGGTMNGTD